VSERTEERIPELLGPGAVDARTRLVLVNAIYFLADWRTPFPADGTGPRPFHLADGGTVDVPTMSETFRAGYAERDGLQVLTLPYRDEALEMVVLLPSPELGLSGLEARLNGATLASWLAAPVPVRVEVHLPRCEFTTEFQLARTLAGLGMPTAFTGAADFSGMVPGGGLAIDDVVHQAYLRVDEQGTEAAAATGVIMKTTSLPPPPQAVFRADRPYLVLIRHKPSGALLFLGRVADPRT
jgi:serpin B